MDQKSLAHTETAPGLSPEDRLDILELMAAYNIHEDAGDAEAWAHLFTADGCFLPVGRKIVGRAALAEFQRRRRIENPELLKRVHWGGDAVIWATPSGAEAQSNQMTIDKTADGYRVNNVSTKADELRRENGKWKFHTRRVVHLGTE